MIHSTGLPTLHEVEQFFGNNSGSNATFQAYCKKNNIFEFLTKEYVTALSEYLAQRAQIYTTVKSTPIKILEVCAGDGRLTYFLREMIEEKFPRLCSFTASDSGEWNIKPLTYVEKLDHVEALKQIQPDIVICSWMPNGKDLTRDFRESKTVKEYILIGDPKDCGDPWLTWGERARKVPPYEIDGFELEIFGKEFPKQLCMNSELNSVVRHSWTYSFKRLYSGE